MNHHLIKFIISILLFWVLISGIVGVELYPILSILTVVVLAILSNKLRLMPEQYLKPIKFICYFLWLMREIIISSWQLSKIIWSPTMNISPGFIELKTGMNRNSVNLVIFANSITLTPGTFTTNIDKDNLTVHAISKDAARDLNSGIMKARILSYIN